MELDELAVLFPVKPPWKMEVEYCDGIGARRSAHITVPEVSFKPNGRPEGNQFRSTPGLTSTPRSSSGAAPETSPGSEQVAILRGADWITQRHLFALLSAHSIPLQVEHWGNLLVRAENASAARSLIRADAEKRGYALEFADGEKLPDRIPWLEYPVLIPYEHARTAARKQDGIDFSRLLKHPKVEKTASGLPLVNTVRYRRRPCVGFNRRSGGWKLRTVIEAEVHFSGDLLQLEISNAIVQAIDWRDRRGWDVR